MKTSSFPCPVCADVELAPLTTFKMGGRVRRLVEPRNPDELAAAVARLRRDGTPFRMLGGGANVIVDDRGLDEVVVYTRRLDTIVRDQGGEGWFRAAAGVSIASFVQRMRESGFVGAEALVGIPGTIGGATAMNAGGRHGSISDLVRRVRVVTPDGSVEEIIPDGDTFGYRRSIFGADWVVLETVLELRRGSREASTERSRRILKEKSAAQPLTENSAGCVFRNPDPAVGLGSAGRLLDAAGARGWRVGGVEVSRKHANFIVHRGGGRLSDVLELVQRMREAVAERFEVELATEVKIWRREGGEVSG